MAACQILSGISDLQIAGDGGATDAAGDLTVLDGPNAEAAVEAGDDGAGDTGPGGDGATEGATGDGATGEGSVADASDGGGGGDAAAETGPEAGADADAAAAETGPEPAPEAGPEGGTDASDAAADVVEAGVPYEAGVPTNAPSCMAMPTTCGPNGNESCCETITLTGGTFVRSYDGVDSTDASAPATLDYSFTIDRFEVTTARFNNFIQHLPANPPQGAGNYRGVAMTGWNTAWDSNLPTTTAAYQTQVTSGACTTPFFNAGNPNYPMNCVTWYEAFNFCIWDTMGSGRLPTEAEWNYLAAAGDQQRVYPWSSPATATTIDSTFAWYQCGGPGGTVGGGPCALPATAQPVGTDPKGDGFFHQADLAGSLAEATFDLFGPYPMPCTDCANTTTGSLRVYRGGSWGDTPGPGGPLHAAARAGFDPTTVSPTLGWRCVH
jgi:formylglycine-generating enzyme required for sulfatase activity